MSTHRSHNSYRSHRNEIDGTLLLKNHGYFLGSVIGRGSFSTVRVALSKKHNYDKVAIKIIRKYQAPEDLIQKFLPREINVVKALSHKHLIKFYVAIETTHRVYIVMEYASQGSLLEYIRVHGSISETRTKVWFYQLSEAVAFCHKHGVVHRDIKCENILLTKNFDIKLSDFGFSKGKMFIKNKGYPLSETYCGSFAYASPEVLRGEKYRPHLSDVWAMGVVLYAMIFGTLPFDDSNYNELLKQVQKPVYLPKVPNISWLLKALFRKIFLPEPSRITSSRLVKDEWFRTVPNPNTKFNFEREGGQK